MSVTTRRSFMVWTFSLSFLLGSSQPFAQSSDGLKVLPGNRICQLEAKSELDQIMDELFAAIETATGREIDPIEKSKEKGATWIGVKSRLEKHYVIFD